MLSILCVGFVNPNLKRNVVTFDQGPKKKHTEKEEASKQRIPLYEK